MKKLTHFLLVEYLSLLELEGHVDAAEKGVGGRVGVEGCSAVVVTLNDNEHVEGHRYCVS